MSMFIKLRAAKGQPKYIKNLPFPNPDPEGNIPDDYIDGTNEAIKMGLATAADKKNHAAGVKAVLSLKQKD